MLGSLLTTNLFLSVFYIALLIITLMIIYMHIEPYLFKTIKLNLEYDNLPKSFNGFKILFLSDLHTSKYGLLEKRVAKILSNLEETDICIISGDLTYTNKATSDLKRVLDNIKVKGNTYITFGNSEYKSHVNTEELIKNYTDFGYNILNNTSCKINIDQDTISLVGVDDPINENSNIDKAFKDVNPDTFKIFISHCPSLVPDALKYSINLALTGHTHGGQVRLPIINIMYTHMLKNKFLNDGIWTAKKLSNKLKISLENFNLIISRGIGTSKLWIRFRCKPEIYIIELTKNSSHE